MEDNEKKEYSPIRVKVGDIFEVPLENDTKGYLQYIGEDASQLYGKVVRVFKKRYSMSESPDLDDVIRGEVEFYSHVLDMNFGVKDGMWSRVGNSSDIGDEKDAFFRTSSDYSKIPLKVVTRWSLWRMNEEPWSVDVLSDELAKAEVGSVMWPIRVVERMKTGIYQFKKSDYKENQPPESRTYLPL